MAAKCWPGYRPVRPLKKTGTRYPVDCGRCGRRVGVTEQHYDDGAPPPPWTCGTARQPPNRMLTGPRAEIRPPSSPPPRSAATNRRAALMLRTTDRDALGVYYDTIIPPGESGHLHLAVGLNGYFTAAGKYSFEPDKAHPDALWKPRMFRYPDERGEAFDWILDMAQHGDVYGCPNLLTGRRRNARTAVSSSSCTATSTTARSTATRSRTSAGSWSPAVRPHTLRSSSRCPRPSLKRSGGAVCRLRDRHNGDDKIADNECCGCRKRRTEARRLPASDRPMYGWPIRSRQPRQAPCPRPELEHRAVQHPASMDRPPRPEPAEVPGADDAPKPVDMGGYPGIQESLERRHG